MYLYYNTDGRLICVQDENGRTATFTYDKDCLTSFTNAMGETTTFTYDERGHLLAKINADGVTKVTNRYEENGVSEYTYDALGNIETVADPMEGVTTYTYDAGNRLTKEVNAIGAVHSYAYNSEGLLETYTDANERVTEYAYDKAGRIKQVTDELGTIFYTYDGNGLLIGQNNSNGTIDIYRYDALGQLIGKQVEKDGTVLSSIRYTYDEAGNVTAKESSIPAGGLETISTTTMTYDAANRMETCNGEAVIYDAEGNMTYGPSAEGVMTQYTYDCRNRLIQANQVKYEYDGEGDYENALLSAAACIPLAGSVVGNGLKWGAKGVARAEKVADTVKLGSRIVGDGGALILSGGIAVESAQQIYTSISSEEGLTWKDATDIITLGISVAGMGMAGASIAKSGKSLKAMYRGEKAVSNVAVSNATRGVGQVRENGGMLEMDLQMFASKSGSNAVNPKDVKFMQSSIKNKTGDYTVLGNAQALKNGTLKASDLPEMKLWKDDAGQLWTLDHRRLASFRLAELDSVPFRWATSDEVANQMWKMTTQTGGNSIKLKLSQGQSIIVK